jgi:CRP-like cAMP-binding protein
MIERLFKKLEEDNTDGSDFGKLFSEKDIPAKTTLLSEGEISKYLYFIKKGCLRMWFNNDGKDVTFQFFFENQAVSSIESFMNRVPSLFNIESIEPSKVIRISKSNFDLLLDSRPDIKDGFHKITIQRMENYAKLFLSRIKDNPKKRYEELLNSHPEIVKRVPQHYIASYLGITPISLSRIKNKK